MAKVKPFKGIRPPRELVEEVASRPYDVLNSEEARQEAEGNPRSLYHIIKPEIDFAPGTDEHDHVSMTRLSRISTLSRPMAGSWLTIRNTIIYMRRLWTAVHSMAS